MSTFDGIVREFPSIRIDNFTNYPDEPPPLACFLSHVHSDHLKGLESFKSTFVYCTAQTRELLLRLEKYPHRMNFAKGILESRKQTYRRLKNHIKPIPLETPTEIELAPGHSIRVTLFDANHCLGSCMFLIEGNGKAILYTGDLRSETWWVNTLTRNPVLLPYTNDTRRLDNIYLDTTFTSSDTLEFEMPTKAEGLSELIEKVSQYPSDTVFYLNTWTFGYEEVWIALAAALRTRVHLDDYRWRLYSSQRDQPTCYGPQTAPLVGYKLGNHEHPGCLTNSLEGVRIHSCERGTRCEVFQNPRVIWITPIIVRHKGHEIAEIGAGGGQGDLNQTHSLELYDQGTVQQLLMICRRVLQAQPDLRDQMTQWFSSLMKSGKESIDLDLEILRDEIEHTSQDGKPVDEFDMDNLPIDRLVPALTRLITGKSDQEAQDRREQQREITFPFSRHSSYLELRELVQALRPKDIYPCTVDPSTYTYDVSMEMLFGDVCSANIFHADKEIHAELGIKESEADDEESQRRTPSPQRSKPTSIPPQPSDPAPEHARIEQTIEMTGVKAVQSRSSSTVRYETPDKRVKRSRSTRSTPGSNKSERNAHMDTMFNAALGRKWEKGYLTSVNGYHNQEPEKEL
ncbi:hypothetical protein D6C90_02510 [Aureobasidium pullulans]|uniref:Protein artemis n=1 Tax=Aureobasidium pullulans TaxID=5580 RepID=A0A4S9VGI7_AURPU|nr:hypothetical protein D6C90_02510 [Aureobasidium pullulans]